MKNFIFMISFFLLVGKNSFAEMGEIWFFIHDDGNTNYYVTAHRISTTDPLFGDNIMEVGTNIYDTVTSDEDRESGELPEPYNIRRGFDFLHEPGVWPSIGLGKLEFSIYRGGEASELMFRFKMDFMHSFPGTDFTFKLDTYTGIMLVSAQGVEETEVQFDDYLKMWELRGQQQDLSIFVNNIELTNFLATGPEPSIKTIFTAAVMGFPYPENFQTGDEYEPGTVAPLWRGAYYGLTVSQTSYTKNNIVYNFRNWEVPNNFSSSATFRIKDPTSEFRSMFQPTYPLTVSGYLEGGTAGNYELTWHNPDPDIVASWQFGNVFNAFRYEFPNFDAYTVTIPSSLQELGTTWFFRNWDDGSTNLTKANLQITSPVSYTAYYKGLQRSDNADAYNTSSQRKAVRLHNGTLLNLYESLGNIYIEKSYDDGQSWYFWGSGGNPFASGNNYSTPSIDWIPWTGSDSYAAIVNCDYEYSFYKLKVDVIREDYTT